MLSSVDEKGENLNLKRYLLFSTHHGVFPKYRKAFLAEFAYLTALIGDIGQTKPLIGFCMLVFTQILHLYLC